MSQDVEMNFSCMVMEGCVVSHGIEIYLLIGEVCQRTGTWGYRH